MKQGKGRHAVPGHSSSITCILQVSSQQFLNVWFVLYNQNTFHVLSPAFSVAQNYEFIVEILQEQW